MTLYLLRKKIQEQINQTGVAMETSGLTDLFKAEMDGGKLALNHILKMLDEEIATIEFRLAQLKKRLEDMEQVPTTPIAEFDLVRARIAELVLILGEKDS